MILLLNKRKILIFIIVTSLLILVASILYKFNSTTPVNANTKGYIAIIIDDFGNNSEGTEKMLKSKLPITAAVMPNLSTSEEDARIAHENGIDVIMHVPMEPEHGKPQWLGPKAITTNLSEEEIKIRVKEGLEELKYCIGMNNHMGSKVTQDKRVMKAILEVAKEMNLMFIDSKTTPKSVVRDEAEKLGVISLNRDVFLDNIKDKKYIKGQINKLGELAIKRGYAIGIGHVGVEGGTITYESIKEMYPELTRRGIKLVSISELAELIKKE